MEERKGAMKPEQQVILEKIVKAGKFEAFDGIAINLIDDLAIEAILKKASPGAKQVVYSVIDTIFIGLASLVGE